MQNIISASLNSNATFGETNHGATTVGCRNTAPVARPDLTRSRGNLFNDTEPNTTQYNAWQRFFMPKRPGKVRISTSIFTLQSGLPRPTRSQGHFDSGEVYENVPSAAYGNAMRLFESVVE
ncbi:hypothetical protein CKAH01_04806 [Colletotrichum kahawae]|uniref:Uncharacterized protein n=1 Tax=Colletotrichum kahawae TaxID=34407 RepID=A0AAD9YHB3_COLKA|nr:hypothetical protein CKAH01_04806 [Colletotrichum kahawae]